jgi:hypothetical protein
MYVQVVQNNATRKQQQNGWHSDISGDNGEYIGYHHQRTEEQQYKFNRIIPHLRKLKNDMKTN